MATKQNSKTIEKDIGYCTMQYSDKCKNKNGANKISNFYSTADTTFFKSGKLHICKDCIKEYCYNSYGELMLDNFKKILMLSNLPFLSKELNSALESGKDIIGTYLKNIWLNYKGCGWEMSDKDIKATVGLSPQDTLLQDFKPTQEMMVKWGFNYKPEQYIKLENFCKQMSETNTIETAQDKDYLKKLAVISMKLDEELEVGNYSQAKQLGDLFSKYMADSKFRASDKTDADKSGGLRSFSQIYAEVEKDEFIPPWYTFEKIKGLTQDLVDKTIMHIENFTLRANKIERMSEPPMDTPNINEEGDIFIAEGDNNG